MKSIKVMFLASEADPFVKIGGLGDVAGSLPAALNVLDGKLQVRLFLPLHNQIDLTPYNPQKYKQIVVPVDGAGIQAEVSLVKREGVEIFFFSGKPIAENDKVYSPNILNDSEKYMFFVKAAMQFVESEGWQPDILFANDWHTALSLHIAKNLDLTGFWQGTKRIIAIHNLAYMGAGSETVLSRFGVEPLVTEEIPWWGKHFPLPMGAVAAHKIVTVSPTYAKEIQTEEFGCGLQDFFKARAADVVGIVNGIDLHSWDPSTDKLIPYPFSASDLTPKALDKAQIQIEAGLPVDQAVPLLAMVTRMDHQKGVDILVKAIEQLGEQKFQLIILGTGNPEIEENCKKLQTEFPGKVSTLLKFDSALSRRIYAGADMILMPSRYEPCGIAQMISMRYGAVPIARSTGGLRDTIQEGKTGFLFEKIDEGEFAACISKALLAFEKKNVWKKIQQTCLAQDFSWARSATKYQQVFENLQKES